VQTLTRLDLRALSELDQLRISDRRGLARGSPNDDPARAAREVQLDKPLPRTEIYRAIRPHRRRNGDQTA